MRTSLWLFLTLLHCAHPTAVVSPVEFAQQIDQMNDSDKARMMAAQEVLQQADQAYGTGNFSAALEMYASVANTYLEILGASDLSTLQVQNNWAGCLATTGEIDKAIQIFEGILNTQKTLLGINHPATLQTLHNLVALHINQQEHIKAIPLMEQYTQGIQKEYGRKSTQAQKARMDLVDLYLFDGQFYPAKEILLKEIALLEKMGTPESLLLAQSKLGIVQAEMGEYLEAKQLLESVLEKERKQLGATHPQTLTTLNHLGGLYEDMGLYDQAQKVYLEDLDGRKQVLGPEHPDTAATMSNLALFYTEIGKTHLAEDLLQEALTIFENSVGELHPDTIGTENNLAYLYVSQARNVQAHHIFEKVYERSINTLGENHPDSLAALNNLSTFYYYQGHYKAEEMLKKDIIAKTQSLGVNHPDTLATRNNLANLFASQGRYALALEEYTAVLTVQTSHLGTEHPDTLITQNNLANLWIAQGDYAKADVILTQTFATTTQVLGLEHPTTLTTLSDLAYLRLCQGNLNRAEELYQQNISLQEKIYGTDHPNTLRAISSLGTLYQSQGLYETAEQYFLAAKSRQEKALGKEHPDTLNTFGNLATLYENQGNYQSAEPLILETWEIKKQVFGDQHPHTLNSLNTLVNLYEAQGRYTEAEPLAQFNLTVSREILGPKHPNLLYALQSMANLYESQEKHADAVLLFEENVDRCTEILGSNHPLTLQADSSLANSHYALQNYDKAKELFHQTLKKQEEILGNSHPNTLLTLNNLANLYQATGDFKGAQESYLKVLEAQKQHLGPSHPNTLTTQHNLVTLYTKSKQIDKAVALAKEMAQGEEVFLSQNFVGSQKAQQDFFETFDASTNLILALHLQHAPKNSDAQQLAFETVLRRKGRVLDAQTDMMTLVRRNGDSQVQNHIAELKQLQLNLSDMVQNPPISNLDAYESELRRLNTAIQKTEQELALKSPYFAINKPVTIEELLPFLPPNSALLEYVVYTPESTNSEAMPAQLAVYVLSSNGAVFGIPLGDYKDISEQLKAFRQTRAHALGKYLHEKIMAPILKLNQDFDQLFLSPDMALNLIPFEILENQQGYLLDQYQIHYLSTGRDLLRFDVFKNHPTNEPVVFANPNFGESAWAPLPGSQEEAQFLSSLIPDIKIFTGNDANLDNIMALQNPKFVHFASHGFIHPDDPYSNADDNPMHRSGLIFANSKGGVSPLYAADVVNLSLDGTEVVVLSACESGLGETSEGDGIYGLRRAFTLAGAQRQILSLWPINDAASLIFMEHFYTHLQTETAQQALQHAKEDLRASTLWNNPIYWAPFVLTGNWN